MSRAPYINEDRKADTGIELYVTGDVAEEEEDEPVPIARQMSHDARWRAMGVTSAESAMKDGVFSLEKK